MTMMKFSPLVLLAAAAFTLSSSMVAGYEVGCLYPSTMPDPIEARLRLHQYPFSDLMMRKVETPVVIHVSSLSSLCQANCLAYHDDTMLNALTLERPLVTTVPAEYHNSWSRLLCMAQCFAILSYEAGHGDFYKPLFEEWGLEGIEPRMDAVGLGVLSAQQSGDATPLETLLEREDYHPFIVGQIVATEALLHATKDGWNALGSLTYDDETDAEVDCTANCERYKDTYGYFPRNHPGRRGENATTKYVVEGDDKYWQPLVDNDMNGFFMAQEHVTPHIGFKAKTKLYESVEDFPTAPDPQYDYRTDALEVVERLRETASDPLKKKKIAFFDNKLLVIDLIERELRNQFEDEYSFEDEILYIHGLSAGEYEATLMSWREKVKHDLVRPTTVIQRWGSDVLETFGGDKGADAPVEIAARDFQAFQRVMPHSEYPSASACICTAYAELTDAFTRGYYDNATMTDLKYRCELNPTPECGDGFDFANVQALLHDCGQSRLWAGFHFTKAVTEAEQMCKGVGLMAWDRIAQIRNGSTLGNTFRAGDDRPRCSIPNFGDVDISKAALKSGEEGEVESGAAVAAAWTSLLFAATTIAPFFFFAVVV